MDSDSIRSLYCGARHIRADGTVAKCDILAGIYERTHSHIAMGDFGRGFEIQAWRNSTAQPPESDRKPRLILRFGKWILTLPGIGSAASPDRGVVLRELDAWIRYLQTNGEDDTEPEAVTALLQNGARHDHVD